MDERIIPADQERAVAILTRYARLASSDFLLGVLVASSDTPLIPILEAELDRRLALLENASTVEELAAPLIKELAICLKWPVDATDSFKRSVSKLLSTLLSGGRPL